MARKLTWKDLAALPRFLNRKLHLDNTFYLVYNPGLLSSSLLSILTPNVGFCTAVEPLETGKYPFLLGQIYYLPGELSARLIFLAPDELSDHPAYLDLTSHLCAMAGERGAVQILAEVQANSPEEDILSRSGYRAYAEQQIWKLPPEMESNPKIQAWVPASRVHPEQVGSAYQRLVPAPIQRVEPPPSSAGMQGLICWQEGRILGLANIEFGPRGILIDLALEPNLPDLDQYLDSLFSSLPNRFTRDYFLRIRSYQQTLASALERAGAEAGPSQRAMVKRLTVYYHAKQTFRVQGFEEQPDITTPIARTRIKNRNHVQS
jgi:hypothetical protein